MRRRKESEKRITARKSLEVIAPKVITLADEAAERITHALKRYSASGVRILASRDKQGAVSYTLDLEEKARSDDLVLEEKGVRLYVDPSSTQHVQGIEIRYVKTGKGSGFAIFNPGAG